MKMYTCIVCGTLFEARKRKYKATCSLECGMKNYQRWLEGGEKLARQMHQEEKTRVR